ncbi:MAG: isoleucine--tRNA ligase [Pseudomonadota bacterium]
MTTDYRDTVFLPKTAFPMKAGLPNKEPKWLERWAREGVYEALRAARKGAEKFVLHDGPPYANGDIHMGHAMNKVLKDVIVRSQSMLGKDAPYVPGWDCHGLPIEWKIEEKYRKKKKNKDDVDPIEFRQECRDFAQHWVNIQSEQFKRLGVYGDWDDPYLTMTYEAEATIVAELLKFAETGQLYRGAKPVMWSPVEKTALAEAEVEYEDIVSTQIDVAFEITESPIEELVGAKAVIWTTTPWTIPVNQALAYGPEIEYVAVGVSSLGIIGPENEPMSKPDNFPNPDVNRRFIVAAPLLNDFKERYQRALTNEFLGGEGLGRASVSFFEHWSGSGNRLAGTIVRHPMHHLGGFFAKPRPLLPGEFVTTDAGTGLVHMAPDHGEDDFELCKANGIDPVFAVEPDGKYRDDWAWLGGQGNVINKKFTAAEGPICSDLRGAGGLLSASDDFSHSYPHSWRSKAKIIFRCTPQWFIPMDDRRTNAHNKEELAQNPGNNPTLRGLALDAIERTRWVPAKSKNRISAMVEGRPDWVISRQRAWGVPIALYLHKKEGTYLNDPEVNARIIAAFKEGGADAWFTADHQALLGETYNLADYEPVNDILDVWFDSGSTHAFVVEGREALQNAKTTLYVEGSDQHRGWFQSSLLESCGTRGHAPFDDVLTHGFALDGKGKKMSKSDGNTVDPKKVVDQYGADILRLWAVSTDYFDDVRISDEIIKGSVDAYRKLRNTLRFLLGSLEGFDEAERLPVTHMPELERYILHRIAQVDEEVRQATHDYDFGRLTTAVFQFCIQDLSAFYFDIRKDCLYCDPRESIRRKAARTVLDTLFHCLTSWLAPVLVFTAEEVWRTRMGEDAPSVHLNTYVDIPADWRNEVLAARWEKVRQVRRVVTGALEIERREKTIGSSLQAAPHVYVADKALHQAVEGLDLADILITSGVTLEDGAAPDGAFTLPDVPSVGVIFAPAAGEKCQRCWKVLEEVRFATPQGDICRRCADAVSLRQSASA